MLLYLARIKKADGRNIYAFADACTLEFIRERVPGVADVKAVEWGKTKNYLFREV